MLNKRGQEGGGATLGTIVTIILLVLLLVILIWSFTASGREFWAKTINLKGGTTLDSAIQGCNIASDSGSGDSFCAELKNVNIEGTDQYVTCNYLKSKSYISSGLECSTYDDRLRANCVSLKKTGVKVNGQTISAGTDCESLSA